MLLATVFLLFICFTATHATPELTFEELFQAGKNAYTEGNWPDCVAFMRRAYEDFRYVEEELIFCRRKCRQQVEEGHDKMSTWHADSERALCVLRCKRDKFTENRPELKKMSVFFDFMERRPYEYLHICYWKQHDLSLAVQSAYTFLVRNPLHPDTLHALEFYMDQPGYDEAMLTDALRMKHEKLLMDGVVAYESDDWSKCIADFDSAFEAIVEEDDRCRLACEDKIDWSVVSGNPELDILVTSMRSTVLRCAHNCMHRISVINGRSVGSALAMVYEYVHFCQFKMMRGSDAMRSVASYLLFGNSPLMYRNRLMYKEKYGKEDTFVPFERALEIHRKREIEARYLQFIDEKFKYQNNEYPPERRDDHLLLDQSIDTDDRFPYEKVSSLISPEECRILRSPLPNPIMFPLVHELQDRVRELWPSARFTQISCQKEPKQASCEGALVLSIDEDCSTWLSKWYTGCAMLFCVPQQLQ